VSLGAAEGVVTLVEGSAFCLSGLSGEIDPERPQGLIFRDTRFLSELVLRVNGHEPEPLAATNSDPFSAIFVLRGPAAAGRADSHVLLTRRRYIGRGMREDLEVRNYAEEASYCSVEFRLGADFADLFEVKEGRVEHHGSHSVEHDGTRVTFAHVRNGFRRATHVDFSEVPNLIGELVRFEVIIPPRSAWSLCVQVTPVMEGGEVAPTYECGQPVERSIPAERLEQWTRRLPEVHSGHEGFGALLRRSARDLAALRIFDPEFPDRAVVAAGAPWFMTLFGRDSILTSWMAMLVDPDLALGTLQTLARFQATEIDPLTEAEPGRILHEMRFGESSSLALGGGRIYYGTADATPLFVMLVGELTRWGSRRDAVDDLVPAADRALAWIEQYGDRDGDGYVEYQRTSDRGLQNQGWKDSWDAIRFRDGTLAQPPIALCEVQAYVYSALNARAHIAEESDDDVLAGALRDKAAALKQRFNEDFWIDDRDGGYLAIGLDRDKRKIDGIGSNMGHCLWTGIVDEERAPAVARALMAPTMVSGWGVRTLSEVVFGYNPLSYHCGSVWPHDNAIIAAGLMRYGFVDAAHQVMRGLVEASAHFGGLLPELFGGVSRNDVGFPVPYPTSCSPQAWAAAAPLLFLRTMLCFEPDFGNSKLHLAPMLPPWIGRLRLGGIPVMGGHVTLEAEVDTLHALEMPAGLELVSERRAPTQ
jgi:glycogen debranching enzyme